MSDTELSPKKSPLFILKVVIAICLIVLAIGYVVVYKHPAKSSKSQPEATVEITPSGFVPATLSVKPGTKVIWVNRTEAPHQVASHPYPSHTNLPGLFSETVIDPDESYSFVFDVAGDWGYQDQLNPKTNGRILVR